MAKVQRMWCGSCEEMGRAEFSGANHILHLLLSVITFGLWLPVWLFVSLNGGYRCAACGDAVNERRAPGPRSKHQAQNNLTIKVLVLGGVAAIVAYGYAVGNLGG